MLAAGRDERGERMEPTGGPPPNVGDALQSERPARLLAVLRDVGVDEGRSPVSRSALHSPLPHASASRYPPWSRVAVPFVTARPIRRRRSCFGGRDSQM